MNRRLIDRAAAVLRTLRHGAHALGLAALCVAGPAQAGLVGDTVTAQLQDLAGAGGVVTPFAPSAVVGSGAEFTALWAYTPLNQLWQVVLDIDDTGFSVLFTDVGGGNDHDLTGFTFLGLRLGDLDPGGSITGVTVLDSPGAAVQSIGTSPHGITVQWNGFQFHDSSGAALAGGSSRFGIQTSAVPEPGTAALVLVGLLGLLAGAVRRRAGAALMASASLGIALPCAASGELGSRPACATAAECTAGLYSSVFYQARRDVVATPGYNLGSFLAQGATVLQDAQVASDGRTLSATNAIVVVPPVLLNPWAVVAGARARTEFGANHAAATSSRAVSGTDAQGDERAQIQQSTTATGYSAWQDVWRFSAAGRFGATVVADGNSSLDSVSGLLPSTFQYTARDAWGDWYLDVRIWDMDHFSVSDDFELGGPTLMARATLRGDQEQRASFAAQAQLGFDFVAGVTYVVTSNLTSTVYHGSDLDLFNTGRITGVSLGGGATLSALSGHDYLAAVPEPGAAALLLAGGATLLLLRRRRAR